MNRSFFIVAFVFALLLFCAGCGGSGGFEGRDSGQNTPKPTPSPAPTPDYSGPPGIPF